MIQKPFKSLSDIPLRLLSCLLLFVLGCGTERPPNVIVFLVDDLGWKDTGVYGSTFYETPNINRLACEGVRFTQAYAASPVCSPTRASLMTGRHPARLHITNWIGGKENRLLRQADYEHALPLNETTIGESFKAANYSTAYFGKWHLGMDGFRPDDQGFTYVRSVNNAGQPGSYFPPYRQANFPAADVPDLHDDPDGTYLTDRLTDLTIEYLKSRRDSTFFLVLSHYAVHTPLQAPDSLTGKYNRKRSNLPPPDTPEFIPESNLGRTKTRQDRSDYAAMIESVDQSIGRLLTALREFQLTSNTIIVFVSDNGGLSTLRGNAQWAATSNSPLRAGKGLLYEGGIRIPLIIWYPTHIPAGNTVDTPVTTNDLVPTLLDLADLPEHPVDGVSLVPVFGTLPLAERALYWHFPHYHGSGNRPSGAIRKGDWKLIEWFEDGRLELYDLATDLSETTNLAETMPAKAAELQQALHDWHIAVNARMPTPNPDWIVTGHMSSSQANTVSALPKITLESPTNSPGPRVLSLGTKPRRQR